MVDSLTMYYQSIADFETLTAEEEHSLAIKALNGDESAKERLLNCNLKLVAYYVNKYAIKYAISNEDKMDLIQEGNLGLMRAIEGFDPYKGTRFSTYATPWIKKYIFAAIDKDSDMNVISWDEPYGEDDSLTLADMYVDETAIPLDIMVENGMLRRDVRKLLNQLSPMERDVIELFYGIKDGESHTITEISDMYDVTRDFVKRTEMSALEKLQVMINRVDYAGDAA